MSGTAEPARHPPDRTVSPVELLRRAIGAVDGWQRRNRWAGVPYDQHQVDHFCQALVSRHADMAGGRARQLVGERGGKIKIRIVPNQRKRALSSGAGMAGGSGVMTGLIWGFASGRLAAGCGRLCAGMLAARAALGCGAGGRGPGLSRVRPVPT
jgi:hypothetical protein